MKLIKAIIISISIVLSIVGFTHSASVKSKVGKANLANPQQTSASAGGGDSGEFTRLHMPPEHILIPLINSVTGDYNPYVAPEISKWRKEHNTIDKNLLFLSKVDQQEKQVQQKPYYFELNQDETVDKDVNDMFHKIEKK